MYSVASTRPVSTTIAERYLPPITCQSDSGELSISTMVPVCRSSATNRIVSKIAAMIVVPNEK